MSAGKFNNRPPGSTFKGKTAAGCENVHGMTKDPETHVKVCESKYTLLSK
ncbi:protein of unknown function [Xenorhabdus doucetiae]|uniref:Uncharacterized protein n=1 Tax=Xenorhabdus doucetiae TaxID=351671 RepID=A0A068QRG9_9GAMM|nr:protein of unknown function [Xenorhabdus doucetiae]